jgi:hypothetical protein
MIVKLFWASLKGMVHNVVMKNEMRAHLILLDRVKAWILTGRIVQVFGQT